MKREISKGDLSFITRELNHYENTGLITPEQKVSILNIYSLKEGLNFVRIILSIGAVLIGLGVLSFVAANWVCQNC